MHNMPVLPFSASNSSFQKQFARIVSETSEFERTRPVVPLEADLSTENLIIYNVHRSHPNLNLVCSSSSVGWQ